MASPDSGLEAVTIRGVTLLFDPSTLVAGCTYLLAARDFSEPLDSVPTSSAALLLNLGREDISLEQRQRSRRTSELLLNVLEHSAFAQRAAALSAPPSVLAGALVSIFLILSLLVCLVLSSPVTLIFQDNGHVVSTTTVFTVAYIYLNNNNLIYRGVGKYM